MIMYYDTVRKQAFNKQEVIDRLNAEINKFQLFIDYLDECDTHTIWDMFPKEVQDKIIADIRQDIIDNDFIIIENEKGE